MKVAISFDLSAFQDVQTMLSRWLDSVSAGELDSDEIMSGIGGVAEELDESIVRLRRALGW